MFPGIKSWFLEPHEMLSRRELTQFERRERRFDLIIDEDRRGVWNGRDVEQTGFLERAFGEIKFIALSHENDRRRDDAVEEDIEADDGPFTDAGLTGRHGSEV